MQSVRLAGYCRISVDEELDRENTSIENQKAIIEDYVKRHFPDGTVDFFEDRDRSGYTFEQREGYQLMRPMLVEGKYDILIIKDFSRFSRRNGRGLVELEELRDMGIRIISIGDGIDYPTNDDWLTIQLHFFVNEMPVTDTSKKVRNVIRRRQADGKWICAVPYGYVITNTKTMEFEPDQAAAQVVREIFRLYNEGWGYKRIANYLTSLNIPTPRMLERMRMEEAGKETKIRAREEWSVVTIQGIIENDFYIGTLRQGKYARKKINGADIKTDEENHIVFENNHEPIIDYRTFITAREQRKKRSVTHYRGIKINENAYSGFLFCGDCGSTMFAMSRRDLRPAYTCGAYHRRGRKGCTSHHIRVDVLDGLLKEYIKKVRDGSEGMLKQLEQALRNEADNIKQSDDIVRRLTDMLESAKEELKATKRQKIRELIRRPPGQEDVLEEIYGEMEAELLRRIEGLRNQIALTTDRRNTVIRANRTSRNVMEVFDAILNKERLSRTDLELIIDRILVYEDHLKIKLKRDIDALLSAGSANGEANFPHDTEDIEKRVIQSSAKRTDKVFRVNVISEGDPLEIYTDKDGEVIFKKYSPMGEMSSFTVQMCDTLNKTTGCAVAITDRDTVISVAGASKREIMDKHISEDLKHIMEGRQVYQYRSGDRKIPVIDSADNVFAAIAAPIIAEGDVAGCVVFLMDEDEAPLGETEYKLSQTVAGFLGKQMED